MRRGACSCSTSSERFVVTDAGSDAFGELGIDVDELAAAPRPLTRVCADWSEQREHLAGSLGRRAHGELLRRGWVIGPRGERVVDVSAEGFEALTAVWASTRRRFRGQRGLSRLRER